MQQFQVPQFIDVEDKLFGPFTIKQFVYVAGGGGMIYLYLELLPNVVAFILALPTGALALALAFHKINGQSFIKIVQAFIGHMFSSKMYLWQKNYNTQKITPINTEQVAAKNQADTVRPQGRLSKLSWSLDVLDTNKETEL